MTTGISNLNEHKISLASELIDDIELSRLTPDQLLFKAYRLARICDNVDIRKWLYYELKGYSDSPESRKYMDYVWRWTNKKNDIGYWVPFSSINSMIQANEAQLRQLQVPDINVSLSSSNPHEVVTGIYGEKVSGFASHTQQILSKMAEITNSISNMTGIRSRVMSSIHTFVSDIYYGRH